MSATHTPAPWTIAPYARLIAAAPDLLAALETIQINLSLTGTPSEAELSDMARIATAAIAKATP